MRALILTYHAIEDGPPPLCVSPELFREHLDTLSAAGARVVSVSALVDELQSPTTDEPLVAVTFDDGFESVARFAAPLLSARGLAGTVFCVAGHVGGSNDWPSDRAQSFSSTLVSAAQIAELVSAGIEIGSHGFFHQPASEAENGSVEREVRGSRAELERVAGAEVRTYAYPYGALPHPAFRRLVEQTYDAACTTRLAYVSGGPDLHALPRIDAHYVRHPELLRRAVEGSLRGYLLARGLGSRARRAFRPDYVTT